MVTSCWGGGVYYVYSRHKEQCYVQIGQFHPKWRESSASRLLSDIATLVSTLVLATKPHQHSLLRATKTMSSLAAILIFTALFAFFTYACIIADPESSTIAGFFMKDLPSLLFQQLERIIGKKGVATVEKWTDRSLQLVYLVVVLGSWSIIFTYGYEAIQKSNYISNNHQYAGYAVFAACMSSWHYACHTSPGSVTSRTIALYDHYPYDSILYYNKQCPTLNIRKVARSKYDRFSKQHVPRFDHFCGWLNQAVGERNYRWFLLFLMVHVGMCYYGTWAMGTVLYGEVVDKNLLNATFFNAVTGTEVNADYIIVFHYMMMRYFEICGVLLLMTVMSVMLSIFLGFHLYITARNMTTNEYFKWKAVRRWHKKMKQKYEETEKEGRFGRTNTEESSSRDGSSFSEQVSDVDVGCTGPASAVKPSKQKAVDNDCFDPGPMPKNIYE